MQGMYVIKQIFTHATGMTIDFIQTFMYVLPLQKNCATMHISFQDILMYIRCLSCILYQSYISENGHNCRLEYWALIQYKDVILPV